MAGEFCNKHDEGGRWCTMVAGHSPHPCHFGGRRPRLGASTTDPSPSVADYQREKWEQETGACSCTACRTAGVPASCSRCTSPAAMLGESLEHIRKARALMISVGRVGAGRIADVLGEAEERAEALVRGADTKEAKP